MRGEERGKRGARGLREGREGAVGSRCVLLLSLLLLFPLHPFPSHLGHQFLGEHLPHARPEEAGRELQLLFEGDVKKHFERKKREKRNGLFTGPGQRAPCVSCTGRAAWGEVGERGTGL